MAPRSLSILFAPFGSEGDVRPALWLAGGLAARGHRITFVITPYYRHLVTARGWRAVDIGTAEDFAAGMRNPLLWQPRAGSEHVLRIMIESLPRYAEVLDGIGETFDLVIGTTLGTGAFTWAEKRGIPRLMLHLQPMCVRSMDDCPVFIEGWEWLCRSPRFVKWTTFKLFDFVLSRKILRSVNDYRERVGLAPLRRVYEDLWNGADGVAALFPDWYAPPQRDWPRNLRQFGFPREPAAQNPPPLAAELEKFLSYGEAPIIWTHGSANLDTEKFAAGAREATAALGARGLLVGPAFQKTQAERSFLATGPVPFAQIFPRGRAIVHHGGIGTSAQSLAAGVPQLVIPRSHDQPDNAARLVRLGVGEHLRYGEFSGATAAEKLRALLADPAMADVCVRLREKIRQDNSLPSLCEWAEELAGKARAAN